MSNDMTDDGERPDVALVISLLDRGTTVRLTIDRAKRAQNGSWNAWSMSTFKEFDRDAFVAGHLSDDDLIGMATIVVAELSALLERAGSGKGT